MAPRLDLALTTGPAAARAHERGVTLLVDGHAAAAVAAFRDAIAEDPCFALGFVALAVALAELRDDVSEMAVDPLVGAGRCRRRLSRGERHHLEVVRLVLGDRWARAEVLGREHLAEFPDDALVRHVLARRRDERDRSIR